MVKSEGEKERRRLEGIRVTGSANSILLLLQFRG